MIATGLVKKLDQLGRIVIPKEIRDRFNIGVNDPIEFYINDNNEIILKKYEPACIFCSHTENVVMYHGKQICKSCIAKLSEAFKAFDNKTK